MTVLFLMMGCIVVKEIGTNKIDKIEVGNHVYVRDRDTNDDYHMELVVEKDPGNNYFITSSGRRFTTVDILSGEVLV